jgi:hypothetical protein
VATPSDFGVKGAPPTHPELLDWLAAELMRCGWGTKHMHRLMVCSSTYRQSALRHAGNAKIDPDNQLWWRWQPRRLEAEVIRDSLLTVSGELDRKAGGPSAPPGDEQSLRRSLYLFQKRDHPPAVQGLFDGPTAAAESCARRQVSTVPLQSLYLLNSEFVLNRARALARRVLARTVDQNDQIEHTFVLTLGRPPDAREREIAQKFFETSPARPDGVGEPPLTLVHFCQALLNVNEFVYVE